MEEENFVLLPTAERGTQFFLLQFTKPGRSLSVQPCMCERGDSVWCRRPLSFRQPRSMYTINDCLNVSGSATRESALSAACEEKGARPSLNGRANARQSNANIILTNCLFRHLSPASGKSERMKRATLPKPSYRGSNQAGVDTLFLR